MSDAVMAVWGDADPRIEAEFNEWYHREHVPERVGMPGWRSGRCYRRIDRGRHRYLAAYEVDSLACFDDPAYRRALDHPTAWTQRMMPGFRNFVRATCRVRLVAGEAAGGYLATVRYEPPEAQREPIARWLAGEALHDLRDRAGITRVQLWEADLGRSLAATAEQAIRAQPDGRAPFAAVIEGTDRVAVDEALRAAGVLAGLEQRGAGDVQVWIYQLMFALAR